MPLTVDELRNEIAHHLQDPAKRLVNQAQLLEFIDSAAWDAAAEGWLLSTQDESLSLGSSDFEYDVPSGLAYIHEIWQETTAATGIYDDFIPWHQWEIVLDASGTPAIHFSRETFTVVSGVDLRLKGQTRPTSEYSSGSSSIDAGMESFIRERAIAYAARNLSRHGGAHAQQYAQLAQEAQTISESLLQQQAEFFRPKRYSRAVPGR
ncbi:hypothetical protein LCGC14_0295100 [marine sediment metagenome]|uniref:Uncharacterized protein n=1 Tax=marine sediment metagenome TaxID=412755 RepID=A0A0F9U953_9ZZZZ